MQNQSKRGLVIVFAVIIILVIIVLVFIFFNIRAADNIEINDSMEDIEIVAENLDIPWEIEFLPNREMIVTERPGNLLRIGKDRSVISVEGVKHTGEGGLLGLAIHPNFDENNWIYLYFTSDINGSTHNRVERYKLNLGENILNDKKVILSNIPGAAFHDGGRIRFGPDNYLYITTGDATNEDLSQNTSSLAGKILRVDENGNIPKDNPFNNEIYSYGHRNSQGLTWDDQNGLWATEHGRSGIQSGFDELNLIEKGKNYGWPIIEGGEERDSIESPIIHSGERNTWAPAGAIFYNGRVFFTGLRGEALYEYDIERKTLKEHLKNEYGRLRAIALKDDYIYISTSNRDGRGNVNSGDDKIIRIKVSSL